jgi:SAM-dependent methyltransferase
MPQAPADRPEWQLPAGVSKGSWDYARTASIATDYDHFHAGHPILDLDDRIVRVHLQEQRDRVSGMTGERLVIDLGCGPGRHLFALAESGWRALGVDLSGEMLRQVHEKLKQHNQPEIAERVVTIQANMVELECIRSQSAHAMICLYSSFGMIRGRANRLRMLRHVERILHPDGLFIVHVHNRGAWLRDPGGMRRTFGGWLKARADRGWEFGDRVYPYRGLPNMFLHIFSRRELTGLIAQADLRIEKLYMLNAQSSGLLDRPWWLPHIRAGGFIAIARRTKGPVA